MSGARPQVMRMNSQAARPPPKNPMSAASKVCRVVTDLFLPMAEGFVPEYTPLAPQAEEDEAQLLERARELFPDALRTREAFLEQMAALYDGGAARAGQGLGGAREEG